jgi:hypothetical protein
MGTPNFNPDTSVESQLNNTSRSIAWKWKTRRNIDLFAKTFHLKCLKRVL